MKECPRDCAACCYNVRFQDVHVGMVENMESAGGVIEWDDFGDGLRLPRIVGKCPYLKRDRCSVRDNELLRPHDCDVLQPGASICNNHRQRAGLDKLT